jgi:FkbM family methyltransferase
MLDFIEIGTSDFDTIVQEVDDTATGICVEPISYYINKLPNRPHVKKVNAAISLDDTEGFIDMYYIPGDVMDQYNLPQWLRGCNSVNKYHLQHSDAIRQFVTIEKVPQLPISKLFADNNVVGVKHLKVDTEGADCQILDCLFRYLIGKSTEYYPLKITFESNELADQTHVREVINAYMTIGYKIESTGHDTVLIYDGTVVI